MTADEIAARVNEADPTINMSSIYRSLALFEDLNLARTSQLGIDESARWEVAHPDDHFHIVCHNCGRVDHHEGELVEQIRFHLDSNHAFRAENIDLLVSGLCEACAVNSS